MMSGSAAVPRPLERAEPAAPSSGPPPRWTAEIAADRDDRTLPKIDVELVVVAVGDRAFLSSMVESMTLRAPAWRARQKRSPFPVMPPATGRDALVCAAISKPPSRTKRSRLASPDSRGPTNIVGGVQTGSDKVGVSLEFFQGEDHRALASRAA